MSNANNSPGSTDGSIGLQDKDIRRRFWILLCWVGRSSVRAPIFEPVSAADFQSIAPAGLTPLMGVTGNASCAVAARTSRCAQR